MPVPFRCSVTLPLWRVAFCAAALGAPRRVRPLLTTLAALGVIASTMPPILSRFGRFRRDVDLLPAAHNAALPATIVVTADGRTGTLDAAIDAPTMKADDASDLVRMDDDGGWQMARQPALADGTWAPEQSEALMPSPAAIVPGNREPGILTTFGVPAWTIPDGPSTMDAVTIAEHQREGGGAPSQRRPVRVRTRSTHPSGRLHDLVAATRELLAWRFRTNHV